VIFVGEKLTVFSFVRQQYEKTLRTTGMNIGKIVSSK